MVFWHTAYKKHHSWLIRKTRWFNYLFVVTVFYSVYWYNRYETNRTLKYLDRVKPSQARADAERRDFGFRERYEPLIPRSRKHYLISKGGYQTRVPYEDQLLGK
jgi:hypothetical protein